MITYACHALYVNYAFHSVENATAIGKNIVFIYIVFFIYFQALCIDQHEDVFLAVAL